MAISDFGFRSTFKEKDQNDVDQNDAKEEDQKDVKEEDHNDATNSHDSFVRPTCGVLRG